MLFVVLIPLMLVNKDYHLTSLTTLFKGPDVSYQDRQDIYWHTAAMLAGCPSCRH